MPLPKFSKNLTVRVVVPAVGGRVACKVTAVVETVVELRDEAMAVEAAVMAVGENWVAAASVLGSEVETVAAQVEVVPGVAVWAVDAEGEAGMMVVAAGPVQLEVAQEEEAGGVETTAPR
tara:strand:- start:701 stop:1060 length:360 start_codon:yes stop_codon:yes gene_type:complete